MRNCGIALIILFNLLGFIKTDAQCISWQNNLMPANVETQNACNYLCGYGIIDVNQDANQLFYAPTRKEIARLLYDVLTVNYSNLPSDNNPVPYIDISPLSIPDKQAVKAMLYLDYSDGVAPFPREYYFIGADYLPFIKSDIIRTLLETFNVAPDTYQWNTSTGYTGFFTDITYDDPHYPWLRTASNIDLLKDLPGKTSPNTIFDLTNQKYFSKEQLYVMTYRLLLQRGFPIISTNDFYTPNNYSVENINNKAGLEQSVFSSYEDPSFDIPGGGISLTFEHSYHSDLTELPYYISEYIHPAFNSYYPLFKQAIFPLGIGWTHSYNIMLIGINEWSISDTSWLEKKLAVRWADGSVEFYDKTFGTYSTPGVKDSFVIINQSGGYVMEAEIVKPTGLRYRFQKLDNLYLLRLVSITDRNGNSQTLSYQPGYSTNVATERLFQVTDNASNRSLTFTYLPNTNYITSVVDPIGRAVHFNIDPSTEDLLSFQDAKNQTNSYQYAQGAYKHLLQYIYRPKGNRIDNTYEKRRLRATQTNSANNAYKVEVTFTPSYLSSTQTSSSQVTITQNGQQQTTKYTHNERGNPTSIVSATQNIKIQYDSQLPDLPHQVRDSIANITRTYQYDANANTIQSVTASSLSSIVTSALYNNFNEPYVTTDGNGNPTYYTYDNRGNLKRIDEPNNVVTEYEVNTRGNIIWKKDPLGNFTDYGYNSFGNLNAINIRGTAISASAQYDGVSRPISIQDPSGISSTYSYDANDNIVDENFDPSGLNYNTHYEYDPNDNLIQIRDPRQLVTTLTYDFQTDDLIREDYGSYNKQWTYETDGSLKTYTDKNGTIFNYTYYPAGDNREGILQSDGYCSYDYNAASRLLNSVTRIGTSNQISYSYDDFQRVKTITYNDVPNNTVVYDYDNNGNITKIVYPINANWFFTYEWNANNRLTGIRDWNNQYVVQYYYRPNGQLQIEQFANGVSTHYVYDSIERLDSIYTVKSNGTLVAAVGAKLNLLGDHVEESYMVNLDDTTHSSIVQPTLPIAYSYDNMNRLTANNQATYTYSGNGSLQTQNGDQYIFDPRDNLLSRINANGQSIMEYDPLENRRRYDSTRYALDIMGQSNILVETNLQGTPKALYLHGLGLVCRIDASTGKFFFYHYDFRGSTIAITDDSAKVVAKYEYDPFGNILFSKEPAFRNVHTYVGKHGVLQDDSNLYFMRARYYDPRIGRFIGEDPVRDNNLFVYGGNNPIRNIDPSGKWLESGFDIASLAFSVSDFVRKPSVWGAAFIAADLLTTALPGAAAGGTFLRAAVQGGKIAKGIKKFKQAENALEIAESGAKYTKSNPALGRLKHSQYKSGVANDMTTFKEYRKIKGIRPDYVDFNTRTIYELKPYNPRAMRAGRKQLDKYKSAFEQRYGGKWNTHLDTY